MDWIDETKYLVKRSGLSIDEIANEAGVKVRWLYLVMSGEVKDPGAGKLYKVWKVVST